MNLVEHHFQNTEKTIRQVSKDKVAYWLLNEGYYPEQYVLPPSFDVKEFNLSSEPKCDIPSLSRRNILNVSYPKTQLTFREFGIIHPIHYHDIVYYLIDNWDEVLDLLYDKRIQIYSYSLPIPINSNVPKKLGPLRSGRMIYEWLEMAEKDLMAESHKYNNIVKTDIKNFYNTIYSHSIGWAFHGQEDSLKDGGRHCTLFGNKIDRLMQYSNKGRTNGIPIGPALSDLLAEVILSAVDIKSSIQLKNQDFKFSASRFKDDYIILCDSKEVGFRILKTITQNFNKYNLSINEKKTDIFKLPKGLFRNHIKEYHPYSLNRYKTIDFKTFEVTFFHVIDIHTKYPGTSIFEKFLSELYTNEYRLKIQYSNKRSTRFKQILKTFSMLIHLKRVSQKSLCNVLAVMDLIFKEYVAELNIKPPLQNIIISEVKRANERESVFELLWYIFFSRYAGLGITNFSQLIDDHLRKELFLKSMMASQQKFFNDSHINLFKKPRECKNTLLAKRLAVFERDN